MFPVICEEKLDVLQLLWYAPAERCDRMRMRRRHNLEPRMERCREYLAAEPESRRGTWRKPGRGLELEIGCGKGSFTCELARQNPETDLIAVEKVPDAMILAMERAKREQLGNVRFLDFDAQRLGEIFARGELDTIYLNFCDPWPKSRDAKFRLTAPSFLRLYAELLPPGGELRFKTDNQPLFDWSLEQLRDENWDIREISYDLHRNGEKGILTDYESRFLSQGIPIKALTAVRQEYTKDRAAGEPPRLRNAALSDARSNGEKE